MTFSISGESTGAPARPAAPAPDPRRPPLPPRYRDLGLLGRGGSGEVRRVHDEVLDAPLAIKLLAPDASPRARARFLAEARVTARLRHPGIVAVQDLGVLEDGRRWFTMEEVQGRTLGRVLEEGASLPRLVELLARVCETVGFAHAAGVVHRDLKPDNVMIGPFGEVRTLDWGLARLLDEEDTAPGGSSGGRLRSGGTVAGTAMGTPGYMPPEQARGQAHLVGPSADVYSLGAILYTLLTGTRPYAPATGRAAVRAVIDGPPVDAATLAPASPPPLLELCALAMARDPRARPADASVLAAALRAWLEGARRAEEGREMVRRALEERPRIEALRARAEALDGEAARVLEGIPPHAPVATKLPGWRLADAAEEARRETEGAEEAVARALRAALAHAPDLPEAHAGLADLALERLIRAEEAGDARAAARAESSLREHDRGVHAAWLSGDGSIELVTDPPGARATLYRYVEEDRRLVERPVRDLGRTPLQVGGIAPGAYVVLFELDGRPTVRLPFRLRRREHLDGRRPGDPAPTPIHLPADLGPGERYVPAGWFWSGGDPEALDPTPGRRLWCDGFVAEADPVTNEAWLAYLNALEGPARARATPQPLSDRHTLYVPTDGGLALGTDAEGRPLHPRAPVVFLTWEQAMDHAAWRAARDGLPWRLPHDAEWEKATRGADGRAFPWGSRFEPTWTRMQSSLAGAPSLAAVDELTDDVGPYGLRGAAGNARNLCLNAYRRLGVEGDRVVVAPPDPAEPYRMVRGGSWTSTERLCRLASRTATRPEAGSSVVGLRLVRSLG